MADLVLVEATTLVGELLAAHPELARQFIKRRMACVGCPVAPFETVEEVAQVYGEDSRSLLDSLRSWVACATRPDE